MAEEKDREDRLFELKREIETLRNSLDSLQKRVDEIEREKSSPPPVPPKLERAAPPAPPPKPAAPPPLPKVEKPPVPTPPPAPKPAEPPPRVEKPAAPKEKPVSVPSFEALVGERWFNWVGIIAILFAAGYFLKYTFDQGWITPRMQFYVGIFFGIGMLALGHLANRKDYAVLARGLWGGGVGILYLTYFAGFKILKVLGTGEPVISQPHAFAGMAAATILGTVVAIVYHTRAMVTLIAIGGYLTPLLLSTGEARQAFLFTYLSILTAGLLFIGNWLRWRFLAALSFTAIVMYFIGWWAKYYPANENLTMLFTSIFFVLFSVETVAAVLRDPGRVGKWSTLPLVLNSVLYLIAIEVTVYDFHKPFMGAVVLVVAAYHLAGALVLTRYGRRGSPYVLIFGNLAAIFFLLFPILEDTVSRYEVPICWAIQGFALFAVSLRFGGGLVRGWGLTGLGLAAVRLLGWDTPHRFREMEEYRILLTARGLTFGVLIAIYSATNWIYAKMQRAGKRLSETESTVAAFVLIVAVTLPIVLISLEVREGFAHYLKPLMGGRTARYEHVSGHWMTLIWVFYATVVAAIARRSSQRALEYCAVIFGAFALGKLAIGDLTLSYVRAVTPLFNPRFLTVAPQVACLFWLGREFTRREPSATALPGLSPVMYVIGHLVMQTILSMEWLDMCAARNIGLAANGSPAGPIAGASALGLALLWGIHGAAVIQWLTARGGSAGMLNTGFLLSMIGSATWLFHICLETTIGAETLFLHFRFVAGAVLAALTFATAASCRGAVEKCPQRENVRKAWSTIAGFSHILLTIALSLEVHDLFFRNRAAWNSLSTLSVVNGSAFALAALWSLYSSGLVTAGIRMRREHLRTLGLSGFVITLAFVVWWQIIFRYTHVNTVLLNSRFLGSAVTAAGLTWCAVLYRRGPSDLENSVLGRVRAEKDVLTGPLLLAANGLMILLLTLEANDYFETRAVSIRLPAWLDPSDAKQMCFSMIWTVYSIGIVLGGFIWSVKQLRLMALLLLSVTIGKVFLFDLGFLQGLYRVLSFLVLGCILVGVSFLYHRFKDYLIG